MSCSLFLATNIADSEPGTDNAWTVAGMIGSFAVHTGGMHKSMSCVYFWRHSFCFDIHIDSDNPHCQKIDEHI